MGSQEIDQYFEDIRKCDYKLLSREEETDLAYKLKAGDNSAREKLICSNLRLVINIAKRYSKFGLPLEDLIQEGNKGLIKAVDRFDPLKGCKLSTYASYWIRQGVTRALFFKNRSSNTKYAHDTYDDEGNIDNLLNETPSCENPRKDFLYNEIILKLKKIIGNLDDREKDVIEMRFELNGNKRMNYREIGERLRLSRERVRQIIDGALKKMYRAYKRETTLSDKYNVMASNH